MTTELNINSELSNLAITQSHKYDNFLLEQNNIIYRTYPGESIITEIMSLMTEELSEPYPIFTYRYFLNGYPDLCIIAYDKETNKLIGSIIGKCDLTKKNKMKGYIAMIAVDKAHKGKRIGSSLCELYLSQVKTAYSAHEVYLETEITNTQALALYTGFGFIRTKKLFNYYLNGNSAYRLKLFLKDFNLN